MSAADPPAAGGVIHDIGYRRYDGPRVGGAAIIRALYRETLRGAFGLGRSTRSKVMPFLLLAAATVPALVVAVIASVVPTGSLAVGYTRYLALIAPLVALFVAVEAPAAVSRDLRYRTVTLYFSRPLRRIGYVRAKDGALVTAVAGFAAVPLLVLYAGALLAKLPVARQTRDLLVGLAGAVLVSVVVSAIGLVLAALTPRRGLGVAAVVATLVVAAGVETALQALGDSRGTALAGWAGLIDPFTLVNGVLVWAFGADPGTGTTPPGTVGGLVYLGLVVVYALGGYVLLVRRYAKVSVS